MDEAHVESIMTDPTQVSCGKWRATANIRYLRPFAKIILPLAACGENQAALARKLLRELIEQYPESELFASEYAKVSSLRVPAALHFTSPAANRLGFLQLAKERWRSDSYIICRILDPSPS